MANNDQRSVAAQRRGKSAVHPLTTRESGSESPFSFSCECDSERMGDDGRIVGLIADLLAESDGRASQPGGLLEGSE